MLSHVWLENYFISCFPSFELQFPESHCEIDKLMNLSQRLRYSYLTNIIRVLHSGYRYSKHSQQDYK
jgi:hypothetical protein